jgi:hypothetical protein
MHSRACIPAHQACKQPRIKRVNKLVNKVLETSLEIKTLKTKHEFKTIIKTAREVVDMHVPITA